MVKTNITPQRFADVCSPYEYLAALNGDTATTIRMLPRFVVDKDGKYIVTPIYDDDGDVSEFQNEKAAIGMVLSMTTRRMEKLVKEFQEAAKNIVNPTNAGDSTGQS